MSKKTVKTMGSIILVVGIIICLVAGITYLSNLPEKKMRQPATWFDVMDGFGKNFEETAVRAPKREKAVTWVIIGGVVIIGGGLIRKFPDRVSRFLGGDE